MSLTVTTYTQSLSCKATEKETEKIMSYMKKVNIYFSAPQYKSLNNFLSILKERKPHVCASWYGSSIVSDEIKNFSCNLLYFDFDDGITDYVEFEKEAKENFHIVQRSFSWSEENPKYHCYNILNAYINDFDHWWQVYESLVDKYNEKFSLKLDVSIHPTKLCYAGSSDHVIYNDLPLLELPEKIVQETKKQTALQSYDYDQNFDFQLFSECIIRLTETGILLIYEHWIRFILVLCNLYQDGVITEEQALEICSIIDDGNGRTFTKFEREKNRSNNYKLGTIIYYCKNAGINEIKYVQQTNYIPFPYVIKDDVLYKKIVKKDENQKEILMVSRMAPHILRKLSNVESNDVYYEIVWKDNGQKKRQVVAASVISTKKELLTLAASGFSINDLNYKDIIRYFDDYLANNSVSQAYMVERLGHIQKGFIHPLNAQGVEIVPKDYGEKQLLEAFKIKGTVETWKKEVFDQIRDFPKPLFLVLASIASPILQDLKVPPFIIDLSGSTSQGKSTALQVARSVWGNEGLINEWNATKVAIERKAGFLNSFPLYMDDTRKVDVRILESIIYQFSGGRSKGRGSLEGSRKELTWNNILISTGEVPLTEYAKKAGGAAARVISLVDEPFGKIKDNYFSDLYKSLDENYGAVGLEFLKKWQESKNDLLSEFITLKNHYIQKANGDEVLTRLSMYFATVHFAGFVLSKLLNIQMDLKLLNRLFDEMANENKAIDKPKQLLEEILFKLDSNRKYIANHDTPDIVWAIYKYDTVCLTPEFLRQELGAEEKMIRKEWAKRGFTLTHLTKDGKEIDYKQVKHLHGKYNSVIVNKEFYEKTGLDFEEDSLSYYSDK
ncbi:Superfamily II helicase and inactivated derivatives [Mycobacteroides abscessus subsp. abscessus]|nr:Superfamily II helicase and inactivated derivatives [Mycobacteroides abscessus subsp. abscessus]